ncbi:hypothetical protein KSF_052690 [Reticulibacter mediterranei]|uniref:Uncharacterized protein n=1 Tax=Reticulibacter mediterranei TaxID=2778369 RepID=A0A8J3IS26_9CHLR|nr:hypothetical protein [Reticulibacter mediterranei]GHO95221.1 hypothetical protein KSF_052690 [Reticulibacter mediterranei]
MRVRKPALTAAQRRAAAAAQARRDCQQGRHSTTPTFRPGEQVCLTCGVVIYCPGCLQANGLRFPQVAHAYTLECPTHQQRGVVPL